MEPAMRPSSEAAYLLADALGLEVAYGDTEVSGKGTFDLTLGPFGGFASVPFKIVASSCAKTADCVSLIVEGPGNLALFAQTSNGRSVEVHVLDRSLVAHQLSALFDENVMLIDVLTKSVKASFAGKRANAPNSPIAWEKVPLAFA